MGYDLSLIRLSTNKSVGPLDSAAGGVSLIAVVSLAAYVMLLLAAYNPRLLLIAGVGVAMGLILQSMRARVWGRRSRSPQTVEASNARVGHAIQDTQPMRTPKVMSPLEKARLLVFRHHRWTAWTVAAVGAAIIGVLAGSSVAIVLLQAGQHVAPPAVVVPRYEGTATYQDGGWDVTDRIVFDDDSLNPVRRLAGLPGRPLSESDGIALLVDRLERQGWSASQIGANTVFARPRHVQATVRLFPLSTLRRLPVVPPRMVTLPNGRQLSFAPGERSQLTLTTGAHVVGITAPAGLRTATATGETFQIDLTAPIGEQVDVQTQLLSPLIRNELGVALGRLTVGGLVKWLILFIAAICADEIKQLVRDLLHGLRRRLHLTLDRPGTSLKSIDGAHQHSALTEAAIATAQTTPDARVLDPGPPPADLAADQSPSDRERPDDH